MSDYAYHCSECGYRTSSVKMDNKDEFHPLLPYCDLKDKFITAKAQLERDELCIDSLETSEIECPKCGAVCDLVIGKHKQPYFACKVHGELADPKHLLNESHETTEAKP